MLKKLNFLKKIFGSTNQRKISSLQPIVDQINSLENDFLTLSDSDLKNKTDEFKKRLKNNESLDKILPEAFADCARSKQKSYWAKTF
jgi:Preprotein translocase subunit SecA (ATPase, RNA helicase)